MFAFELSTATPCGSAPYYSLVIRDPYIIGCHPSADIAITADGISDQHVSLTVLHAHEAEQEMAAAAAAAAAGDRVASAPRDDDDNKSDSRPQQDAAEGAESPEAARADDDDAAGGAAGEHEKEERVEHDDEEAEEEEEEVRAPAAEAPNNNNSGQQHHSSDDRLVVRVTALASKGEGEVRIGNVALQPGDSVIVRDGDVLQLGEGVRGTFRYRPLMVGLEVGTYPEDYVSDLRRMFDQLGATFVDEPIPSHEVPHVPIGQLYCAEELNDSTSCLAAMAYGYSVVQPTYVFEWFAAVSKKASAPLSTLPSPARFEVPVRCTTHPTTTTYLRPESDTCPFSLFPIPSTAMTNRSRADLFAGRVFFFFTDAAATRYWRAVEDCGGAVYGPGDVEAAKEAIHRLVEAQHDAGVSAHRIPNNFYIIIDNTSEAVLLNSGLEAASPELLAFMNEAGSAYGAANLCVMGDHSLFTALLSNTFYEELVPLSAGVPAAGTPSYRTTAAAPGDAFLAPVLDEDVSAGQQQQQQHPVSARTPRSTYSPRYNSVSGRGHGSERAPSQGPATARSASRMSTREEDRRHSLLPRTENRTPSRSQLRSYSRQRARSASMHSAQPDGASAVYENGSYYGGNGSTSGRHGRRHLVPSVIEGEMRSFAEDFDMVRVRIYAFLVREEPKLDRAIATYHRNLYVNIDGMEYALEIKAQAEDFMERVDDLLADPACHGAYTESLRRFWRDCSDMDVKAQHLLHCWDRRFPAAALPRRSRSTQRAGSARSGRRAPSSRSLTPRGKAASSANSPAPATQPPMPTGDYLAPASAAAAAAHPRDAAGNREHRELYTSPEAAMRLQEAEDTEQPFTQQQAQPHSHHEASGSHGAPSSRARGYSASSAQSRRRSLTPRSRRGSHAIHATPHPVLPIDERPPWVEKWAEEGEEKTEENEDVASEADGAERPAYPDYRPSMHDTKQQNSAPQAAAAKSQKKKKTPAGEVAKDTPARVRARSTGRSASKPRKAAAAAPAAPTPAEAPAAHPHPHHRHEAVLSDGSVKFVVDGDDDVTSPLDFVEEHPHSQSNRHAEHDVLTLSPGEDGTHDLTEGTVDFAVDEEPSTHAADLAHDHAETAEAEDTAEATNEDESQVRTAPAPAPQPAPAARPRKAATPRAPKSRSASASATKRSTTKTAPAAAQNGSATNGRAAGQSRRTSKPEAQSGKPKSNLAAWKY